MANPVMNTARRYIECTIFVLVWVACGCLFRPSLNVYQFLGIPLLVFFQIVIARRPLSQLWVRDAGAFQRNHVVAAVGAILVLAAVGALVKQPSSGTQMLGFIFVIAGVFPAAFALRWQRGKPFRQALPAFAAAIAIGGASFGAIALHYGRSPFLDLAKLAAAGRSFLWLFAMLFVIEEVVFRGALDPHVAPPSSGGKQAWLSAVFVSVLWAVWHLPLCLDGTRYNLGTTLALSIGLGVPLSFCWRRSGTLVLPVAAHALIDAYRNVIFAP